MRCEGDRLELLRVVRYLPLHAGMRVHNYTSRAGVAQATREETAAHASPVRFQLNGYGDLMVDVAGRCRNRTGQLVADIALMRRMSKASSISLVVAST